MDEVKCPRCKGSGDIPAPGGAGVTVCFTCGGRGVIDRKDLEWKSKWVAEHRDAPAATRKGIVMARTTTAAKTPRKRTVKAAAPVADTGRTPLHQEASDGFVRGVRELVEAGADVNARDHDGRTPLHWPAYRGHLEIVQLLCEHGADVNAEDHEGRTPLKMATIGRHADVVTYLTERGAHA